MNKQMHILTHMLMLMLLNFSPLFVFLLGLGRLPVVFCQVVHRSMYFCVVRAFVPLFFTLYHFKKKVSFIFSILSSCLFNLGIAFKFSNPLTLFLLCKWVQEGLHDLPKVGLVLAGNAYCGAFY